MGSTIRLTESQKQELQNAIDKSGFHTTPRLLDRDNPHVRVFVAAFDGTFNDRAAPKEDERETQVAAFERNVAKANSPMVEAQYYAGVGTQTNLVKKYYEGATGSGSLERAERAYADFCKQVEAWRKEDPLVQPHVHTISFSRGGGSDLHFLNLVDQRGAEPVRGGEFAGKPTPSALQPGKVTSSAILLDTVVTGQRDTVQLTLPKTTLSVLQVVASLESRRLFSFTDVRDPARGNDMVYLTAPDVRDERRWAMIAESEGVVHVYSDKQLRAQSAAPDEPSTYIYERVKTVHLPGAHSDIGRAYVGGGVGEVAQYIVDQYQKGLGFDINHAPKEPFNPSTAYAHDSRPPVSKVIDGLTGNHTRVHYPGEISGWDGTPRYKVELSAVSFNGDPSMRLYFSRNGLPAEGLAIPPEGYIKHDTRVSADPSGNVVFDAAGSKAFAYDANKDRVTLHGQPLDFLGGKTEVLQRVEKEGGSFTMSVTPQKYLEPVTLDGPSATEGKSAKQEYSSVTVTDPSLPKPGDFSSPEEAIRDLLTNGMRSLNKPEKILDAADMKELLEVLATVKPGDKLAIGNEFVINPVVVEQGAVVFDAVKLRNAVGIEQVQEIHLQAYPKETAPSRVETPEIEDSGPDMSL